MPVVNTNTIKEWFRNLKKPNEDQFWAWLDSFRHKWEKVPLDDVEGLTNALQKKADLVNGTVPESQLPFSVKTSEVLQIGQITATENTVTVSVHSSGKNRIRLNGIVYERAYANSFSYRAVINYSKILIVYALPVVGVFFLAEGAEAPEAIEPELPEGAFVIRRIVVNQTGQIIEAPIADGLKYNEEDGWRNIMLTEPLTVLPYSYDLRSSYWIDSKIGNAVIGGIRNSLIDRNASPSWDGKEFWIYNNTGDDLPLNSATVIEEDAFLFASEITLKDKHSCKVKIRRDALEIVGVLGGSEFDPASLIATDANLQAQISAEVVERAIQDKISDSKIATEKNRNDAQDLLINKKLDKPLILQPDFNSFPFVVAVDAVGNSAKVSAGKLDIVSAIMQWGLAYFIPLKGTDYSTFRANSPSFTGTSPVASGIKYTSSASTFATQRGAPVSLAFDNQYISGDLVNYSLTRKFSINSTFAEQRIFIGVSANYRTSQPSNISFNMYTNSLGVCIREDSSNLFFIWNDSNGSANFQDTGFTNTGANYAYTLIIYKFNATTYKMKLDRTLKSDLTTESVECTVTELNSNVVYDPFLFCIDANNVNAVSVTDYGFIMLNNNYRAT